MFNFWNGDHPLTILLDFEAINIVKGTNKWKESLESEGGITHNRPNF